MSRDPGLHLKNPTALRYFYEVASAGSFRRAAERTHIAASAINRQVKNLEDDLGVLLFERGRGRSGLKLTAAGEIFIHHLKRAMGELATARTEVDALRGLKRGTINLGVNEGFSRELLPQVLAKFHKQHPGVSYEVTMASSPRLVELALSDEIDFALGYNPPAHAGLTLLAKREVGSCVMVPRKHPLAKRSWVRLSECAAYDLAMPDSRLALQGTLEQMFARVGMKPRVVLTTNSYELMRSAVGAGMGIAILTQHPFGIALDHPDAVLVPIRDPRIGQQALVCWTRAGRHLSVASLSLIQEIQHLLEHKL